MRDKYVRSLLRWGVEVRGVLRNKSIPIVDPVNLDSDQAKTARFIEFGDQPTIEDVCKAYLVIYGDEVEQQLGRLLEGLVDAGSFRNINVVSSRQNEIANAQPDEIAVEMEELTRGYYDL